MPTRLRMIRDSPSWDVANGAVAGGIIASWLSGFDWPSAAAFVAFLYTVFLLLEKLWTWGQKFLDRRRGGQA